MSALATTGAMRPAAVRTLPPIKVGVLVDLTLAPHAGGHVKCWQRLAEAAVAYPDEVDLTVHFNGTPARCIELSPSVRYELMPPVLSTRRLVQNVPDHTDLAPWHPRLARHLAAYDVIHTTDAYFCYARTAMRYGRRHDVPVVSSIHTNTPEYARITLCRMLTRVLGDGAAYRVANDTLALPQRVSGVLARRLDRHLERVTFSLGHYGEENVAALGDRQGPSLRRGVDHRLFSPERRDRAWFEHRFGLPAASLIVMYAGKLNAGKNVPLLVSVIERVAACGVPVHLFCAGAGEERENIAARLGRLATCAGPLTQEELARAYASADLFAFPSVIDESGNAAVEALACGLPALLAAGSGVALRVADCAAAAVLPGDDPSAWAAAIVDLAGAPARRAELRRASRAYIEARVPSWAQVLTEDLLPVWRGAAARRA